MRAHDRYHSQSGLSTLLLRANPPAHKVPSRWPLHLDQTFVPLFAPHLRNLPRR